MKANLRRRIRGLLALALGTMLTGTAAWAEPAVNESARDIPVAYDVDVVVVGGGTGAVAAALSAAEDGASVFVAAPQPYLGDDMTATLRLWLEEGEVPTDPLALRIFTDEKRVAGGPDPNRIPFTYETSLPSAPMHRDSTPPGKLTDGVWGDASSQSVQYDGDVTITADLGEAKDIDAVRLGVYYRGNNDGGTNFIVRRIAVSTSPDGKSWSEPKQIENKSTEAVASLMASIGAKGRYVKVDVEKADNCERVLLGELEVIAPAEDTPKAEPIKYPAPRPMHVKKVLDDVLLEAGVRFLYSCFVTDILHDAQGKPCGIVMANRAGRQAVVAKTIIDATPRATVARLAGAKFRPFPAGVQTFYRTVIGGEPIEGENLTHRIIDPPFVGRYPNPIGTPSGNFQIIEYTLKIPMADASWAARAKADQKARSMTYHAQQQFTSDVLFQVPPDPVLGQESADGTWQGAGAVPLGAFQPEGVDGLFILGGCADVSREQAAKLLRPLAQIDAGRKLGTAAAKSAASRAKPTGVKLAGKPTDSPASPGDVGEFLTGVRPIQELPTIPQDQRAIPVLGRYDVVVIGGGTGGAPAGIGAGRRGARTLVVEYQHGLGGVGTIGAISKYYWGNRVGFTATIPGGGSWVIEQKKEWFRTNLLEAGADIWFGSIGCGAFVDGDTVKGAVVTTPFGRGVVLAKVVIDTTGNSDIAAAAGADTYYTDASEFGMQGTGLPFRKLGETYTNTDFTITDETDIVDMWHLYVFAKGKYADAFDQGTLIDTRERRRIVGEFTMTLLDQVLERTYPDTIEVAYSNFDSHGYTIDPYLELEHPGHKGVRINVPYRCLLPEGLEGILVGALGMSCHRDAVPMTRMQPDIQNQGYAAGVAAAMAVQAGVPLRGIDIQALQQHLIEMECLPESVLGDKDNFPLPPERIAAAVEGLKAGKEHAVAVLMTNSQVALPLLREEYPKAEGDLKLRLAHVMAVLGDPTGVDTLIDEVRAAEEWDKGWNYKGMGQFGTAFSPLDQLVVALGRAGDKRAVPVILEKAKLLTAKSEFSHHRAVGLALELIGDRSAAKPLSELLTQPDMAGYVEDSVQEAARRDREGGGGTTAEATRRDSLRELMLARALYRCGDYADVGQQILQNYTQDLRGHLARHAKAVLEEGKGRNEN